MELWSVRRKRASGCLDLGGRTVLGLQETRAFSLDFLTAWSLEPTFKVAQHSRGKSSVCWDLLGSHCFNNMCIQTQKQAPRASAPPRRSHTLGWAGQTPLCTCLETRNKPKKAGGGSETPLRRGEEKAKLSGHKASTRRLIQCHTGCPACAS